MTMSTWLDSARRSSRRLATRAGGAALPSVRAAAEPSVLARAMAVPGAPSGPARPVPSRPITPVPARSWEDHVRDEQLGLSVYGLLVLADEALAVVLERLPRRRSRRGATAPVPIRVGRRRDDHLPPAVGQ